MKERIKLHVDDPKKMESLYRENKAEFKTEFNLLYPEISDSPLAQFWNERLNYEFKEPVENPEQKVSSKKELFLIIILSVLAGICAKIPDLFSVDSDFFYPRNIGFIVFPFLSVYFIFKNNGSFKKVMPLFSLLIGSVLFINLFPGNTDEMESQTLILSCIHLPVFLWGLFGIVFINFDVRSVNKRLDFLRYNGDLIVIVTLILFSGIILTGITFGLFSLIEVDIKNFYTQYIVVFGLAASPLVGTYVLQKNPHIVSKISPVIAKIFSPLVLITLVTYLIAIIISGKDPYNDREFLLTFNLLLIGVMAIILFSIAESSGKNESKFSLLILVLLSVVTVIVNFIALSAIIFRISEWGISPNKLAVLGSNLLILINLLIVTYRLLMTFLKKGNLKAVEDSISYYMPVYIAWAALIAFIFPILFWFR